MVLGTLGCGTSPEFREEVMESHVEEYVPVGKRKSLVGQWKGTGEQSNGSSWDMVLDVTSHTPGQCATIRYPSSGCSGYWECTAAFDGVQLDAVEYITKGRDRCVNEVDVQLVVNEGGRTLTFFAATGEITAEGLLARP
jgi:hypothetical protein